MSIDSKKHVKVATTEDLRLALAAGYEASQIEIDPSNAVAAARAEGLAEGKASATPDLAALRTEAAQAERARIGRIQSMVRAGFAAEATKAIEAGDSPEAFAMAMLEAAADRGITLDAIRRDAPPAAPGAAPSPDASAPPGKSWDAAFESISPKQM